MQECKPSRAPWADRTQEKSTQQSRLCFGIAELDKMLVVAFAKGIVFS